MKKPPYCEDCLYFNNGDGCVAPGNRQPLPEGNYIRRGRKREEIWVPVPQNATSIPSYIKESANGRMKMVDGKLYEFVPPFDLYWSTYEIQRRHKGWFYIRHAHQCGKRGRWFVPKDKAK